MMQLSKARTNLINIQSKTVSRSQELLYICTASCCLFTETDNRAEISVNTRLSFSLIRKIKILNFKQYLKGLITCTDLLNTA